MGVAFFFKYAVDNDWIGPTGRVALGVVAGAVVIGVGEYLRTRARPIFVHVLVGVGIAFLFIAAYAGHALYHLYGIAPAFVAVAAVTLAGGALAVRHRGEPVLVTALITGFLSPVMLSTGTDHPAAFFGYLLVLTALGYAVALGMGFRYAIWLSVAGTAALYLAWYGRYFDASAAGAYADVGARSAPLAAVTLFLAEWLAVELVARRRKLVELQPTALAIVALVAAQAGFASLLYDRPLALGVVLAAVGAVAMLLSITQDEASVGTAAAATGVTALGLVAARLSGDSAVSWGALVWALPYLGGGAYDLLGRRAEPAVWRLFTPSLAGLGFATLVQSQLGRDEHGASAAVLAGTGAVDFLLGIALLRLSSRGAATVLLGQALGLVATALGVLWSGATLTIAWAALAAVVAMLAARAPASTEGKTGDRWWLAGALVLFGCALVHLAAADLYAYPHGLEEEFFRTSGRAGTLRLPFLFNQRALALAATAGALLVAARALSRATDAVLRGWTAVLFTAAHALLVTLAVVEARSLALATPALPFGAIDEQTFNTYTREFAAAVGGQRGRLDMVTTLVLGLYAALLVGLGFGVRSRAHRYLGIGLFALALVKLVAWDIQSMQRIYQTLVLVGMGAMLLGVAFLYARYGRRLLALLRDGEVGGGATPSA